MKVEKGLSVGVSYRRTILKPSGVREKRLRPAFGVTMSP
jgi:hypothetical protein